MGRRYRKSQNKAEQYEAFRLLGTAMHTMEDFPAHSNFCELSLVSMGHQQVFTHVGDSVRIRAPNGNMVAPLVTGECLGSCVTPLDAR
jgi:Heterokaryon incompatibility protein Het-C